MREGDKVSWEFLFYAMVACQEMGIFYSPVEIRVLNFTCGYLFCRS